MTAPIHPEIERMIRAMFDAEGRDLFTHDRAELIAAVRHLLVAVDRQREVGRSAINLAFQFGGIDGDHHKAWVIDQMIRILAGGDYERLVTEANDGDDGPNTYTWNEGIAP